MYFFYLVVANVFVSITAVPSYLPLCKVFWNLDEICIEYKFNEINCFPWATELCRGSEFFVQTNGCPVVECDVRGHSNNSRHFRGGRGSTNMSPNNTQRGGGQKYQVNITRGVNKLPKKVHKLFECTLCNKKTKANFLSIFNA